MSRPAAFHVLVAAIAMAVAACPPARAAGGAESVAVGGETVRINIDDEVAAPRPEIIEWVRRAGEAVTAVYGRFPVKQLTVTIHGGGSDPVDQGVTYGDARIEMQLGPSIRRKHFLGDWMLAHEMFHTAFPTVAEPYLWMNEGLSDYLEPIARVRAGQWAETEAWREFVKEFPRGLPRAGDGGLDNSKRRDRIYWGGNIWWLLADVRIRVQTDNRRSVDDALRAILAAGGSGSALWTLEKVFAVGDQATGTRVLKELYDELGPKEGCVDLPDLWAKLGIKYKLGRITFDDSAPWAGVRRAITAPPTGAGPKPGQ